MSRVEVFVCPAFNAYYYSPYILGLFEAFPAARIRFSSSPFPPFTSDKLALLIAGGTERRVVIDAVDRAGLDTEALQWSDVYGKVNRLASEVPAEFDARVLPIGPSFPRRVWGPVALCLRAFVHFVRARKVIENPREHFANWWRQYRYALHENDFRPGQSLDRFVFSSNSLWKDDMETNLQRASFFDACRSLDEVDFEGGFTPRTRGDVPGFEKYAIGKRYSIREYIEKTSRSALVFNTPAAALCHGFKLGEYLALGKAIISTPPVRELPSPLIHGEHLHLVRSAEEIREAIRRLIADRAYRARLEKGARAYYVEFLRPEATIARLFGATLQQYPSETARSVRPGR